ncbi:hypothetical protein HK405_005943 [Cladochytrium tenue]|nr:hypothetical protein HK405_005943 [Cladochytrium tenue]
MERAKQAENDREAITLSARSKVQKPPVGATKLSPAELKTKWPANTNRTKAGPVKSPGGGIKIGRSAGARSQLH